MVKREIAVTNQFGIHARPASMIVQCAKKFQSEIWLEKDGTTADAKSIMSVMMLAAAHNSTVLVSAKGSDEALALEAVLKLFESGFNEG